MSQTKTHEARQRNGQPVEIGMRVLISTDKGVTHLGDVVAINTAMRFRHLDNRKLRTYRVQCLDGLIRPCHAWHIRKIFDNFPKLIVKKRHM